MKSYCTCVLVYKQVFSCYIAMDSAKAYCGPRIATVVSRIEWDENSFMIQWF